MRTSKTLALLIPLSLTTLFTVPSGPAPAAKATSAPVLDAKLKVEPGALAGSVRFRARVEDARTQRAVAGCDLTVRAGETATAESDDPESRIEVAFEVSLDKEKTSLTYVLRMERQKARIGEQRGELRLPLP